MVKKVMMFGTDIQGKGGVSSVVDGYLESGIMTRLNIDYYQTHCSGTKVNKLFFYIRILPKIIFSMGQYDILHLHTASWWSCRRKLFIVFLGKLFKKKTIVHIHGAKFHVYYKGSSVLEKSMIRFAFSLVDRVVVLSDDWKKRLSAICDQSKMVVIPNCIKCDKQVGVVEKKKSLPKTILFLGELGQRKGVYDLIEAIRISRLNSDEIQVLLYGNGEIEKVRNKVHSLSLGEIIKVPGWIRGEHKNKILDKGYLFVLPSYFEGLPVSILEALAHSVPVISTPVGGIPDAVIDGENGYLVPPDSPKILADRILRLVGNEQLWETFSMNAYKVAKSKFSMARLEENLDRIYTDVCQQKSCGLDRCKQ